MNSKEYFKKINSLNNDERDKLIQKNSWLMHFVESSNIEIEKKNITDAIGYGSCALGLMLVCSIFDAVLITNRKVPSDLLNHLLLRHEIILNETHYNYYVKKFFKDNLILQQKWIRYGNFVRNNRA